MKIIKSTNEELVFILESTPEIANSIRRAIISEVPVLAISKVHFYKNNSILYNEVLALRLGLIPIKTTKDYIFRDKCDCKGAGCPKCTVKFTLTKEGPCMVYAKDLVSSDPNIKPLYPDMPIVKLLEGQGIKLEAEAFLGYGKDHARFNAGMASYQYYPIINTNNSTCKEAVEVCPKKVLELKSGKVVVKDLESCDLCLACSKACNEIKVEGDPNKLIFRIESWGQYEPKELLKTALNELISRVQDFSSKFK